MALPASSFCLHSSSDSLRADRSTVGFNLDQLHLSRNIDHIFAGKFVWTAAFRHNPRRIAVDISIDLVGIKLPPRLLFRCSPRPRDHLVADTRLRSALYMNRARFHSDVQVLHTGQRAGNFLRPSARLLINPLLLGHGRGAEHQSGNYNFEICF